MFLVHLFQRSRESKVVLSFSLSLGGFTKFSAEKCLGVPPIGPIGEIDASIWGVAAPPRGGRRKQGE